MTKIIAELCQNHNGDMSLVQEMVAAASEAGAEYAKIQSMQSKDLTKRMRFEKGLIEGGINKIIKRPYFQEFSRLRKLDLTLDQQSKFIEFCMKYKIKPMTTIFSLNRISELKNMNFDTFKIASFDCSSYKLVEKLSNLKQNLIISTGGTYLREISKTANILNKKRKKFTFLHCISIYPTPLYEAHLSRINYLKNFTPNVGLSDHSNPDVSGNLLSLAAVLTGAQIIERHFTLLNKNQTRDGIVSVNFKQLKKLVYETNLKKKEIKKIFKNKQNILKIMNGNFQRELSESELLNRDYYKGRFASKTKNGKIIFNW